MENDVNKSHPKEGSIVFPRGQGKSKLPFEIPSLTDWAKQFVLREEYNRILIENAMLKAKIARLERNNPFGLRITS